MSHVTKADIEALERFGDVHQHGAVKRCAAFLRTLPMTADGVLIEEGIEVWMRYCAEPQIVTHIHPKEKGDSKRWVSIRDRKGPQGMVYTGSVWSTMRGAQEATGRLMAAVSSTPTPREGQDQDAAGTV